MRQAAFHRYLTAFDFRYSGNAAKDLDDPVHVQAILREIEGKLPSLIGKVRQNSSEFRELVATL